jgi:hypothetical protein
MDVWEFLDNNALLVLLVILLIGMFSVIFVSELHDKTPTATDIDTCVRAFDYTRDQCVIYLKYGFPRP